MSLDLDLSFTEVKQKDEKASTLKTIDPPVEYTRAELELVVTQVEARFWLISQYPDAATVYNTLNIDNAKLRKMLPSINKALLKRELPEYKPFSKETRSQSDLDPSFVVAVNALVDISDKRSKVIKLKAVGLSTNKFNILLKNPANKAYYMARAEEAFANVAPVAKTQIGKLVDSGDLQAIKYYHEFTGIHDPNKEISTNINKMINLFFEVLIRYVKPDVIDVISKEFDAKLNELE